MPRDHSSDPQALDYATCRALRHAWEEQPVTDPAPYGITIDLRCLRCATLRRDVINRNTYQLETRRYVYPDHYRDAEQWGMADWREVWVSTLSDQLRVIAQQPAPQPAAPVRKRRSA